jgi:NADP-dependent aldehyde dehydrogenase
VYAEMSSINPVFLLPHALAAHGAKIAQGYADSLTMGAGQFCTNPGLVIGLAGELFASFADSAAEALRLKPASTMLTSGIHAAYRSGVTRLAGIEGVTAVAQGQDGGSACGARAAIYTCDAQTFLTTSALEDEIFGPCSLLVRCRDENEMRRVAEHVEGQLTVTVHATADDRALAATLLPALERKAGRILFNGFPTGVEVAHAMVHGGPFPSTSDSRTTSVGASAIDRFLRPVCYQDMPPGLLPASLLDENPLGLARVVDGALVVPAA